MASRIKYTNKYAYIKNKKYKCLEDVSWNKKSNIKLEFYEQELLNFTVIIFWYLELEF